MKANEFRSGNYVFYNGVDDPDDRVNKLDSQDIFLMEDQGDEYLNMHEPIPLTEDWLLKFGKTGY